MKKSDNEVAIAIRETLISPNVSDSNLEPANVVDALANIACGLFAVAKAIREHGKDTVVLDANQPLKFSEKI